MPNALPAMPPEMPTICGLTIPDDERDGLLAALAAMQELAGSLYSVEGVRYVDPAIGWAPVA